MALLVGGDHPHAFKIVIEGEGFQCLRADGSYVLLNNRVDLGKYIAWHCHTYDMPGKNDQPMPQDFTFTIWK